MASWIASTDTSGVELIADDAARRRYTSGVDWGSKVFPGWEGDSGEALNLFADLATAIPERRVPRLLRYHNVEREVVEVPGQERHRLWPEARDKFVDLEAAARRAGVPLVILSAFRTEQRQGELAARNRNPNAVAQGHSAHSFGLAIDFKLSVPAFEVQETRTRPMTNIMRMYRSPVARGSRRRGLVRSARRAHSSSRNRRTAGWSATSTRPRRSDTALRCRKQTCVGRVRTIPI